MIGELAMDLSRDMPDILRQDDEFVLCRGRLAANPAPALVLTLRSEHPRPESVRMLEHELALRDELEPTWAVRPRALAQYQGRFALVFEDLGGEPLDRLLETTHVGDTSTDQRGRRAMKIVLFLQIAVGLAQAVGEMHRRGIIHKNIKPAHILVNAATDRVWLTGFGIASRLPRERQAPAPPEVIAGTLAYMAPEQTGRMNRSVDARSDLYAVGVTLYEMLTGSLPFTAADPLEWVHCHIAKKPISPSQRFVNLPTPISQIILKLLAKTAEERYQTASSLERDLRRCLAEWELKGRIDAFALGEHDVPDRLVIPEKLYGREHEVDILLSAFDRVLKTATPELVLVSGYSGIGKSSVVNELHKVLVPPRGLFASGKFDQYKRDIPYSTIAQAFESLVRPLLGKSDAELGGWREAIMEAVGPNGRLMVDVVPDLKFIIGEQPPVAELAPQDAQRRFQLVFRRFIGVFARPEHPLALFLDDLQWLDAATLDLMQDLLTQPDARHLMLIGAYRDNEVTPSHPLMQKLDAIKTAGGRVAEITLMPLTREHLGQLIADALRCELGRVDRLAQLVHEKTGGNPFFLIHFIAALAEAALLTFDPVARVWRWDVDRIRDKGITDNVAELMAGKVSRLPSPTLHALKQLACLGTIAQAATLSMVLGAPEGEVHAALWEAIRIGLIVLREGAYGFLHDRVQEAVYALIPEAERAATHLHIGRVLASRTAPTEFEETIFEIVSQFDRGAALIDSPAERKQVAAFYLVAGKRAKASTAYASALAYFTAGRILLEPAGWQRDHTLTFEIEFHCAECEFLTGELTVAEKRLSALSEHVGRLVDRAAVTRLRVALYTTLNQFDRAIEVGLAYLRHAGIDWSRHPTEEDVRNEYERMQRLLAQRSLDQVLDSPLMSDNDWRATVDVLADLMPPLQFSAGDLHDLALLRMANISLEHGNCDGSCFAYARLMQVLGPRFADPHTAFQLGQLACDLVDRRGLNRFKARVYMCFGIYVACWFEHLTASRVWIRRAFDAANTSGDLTYALYASKHLTTYLQVSGEPLSDVEREIELGLAFARRAKFIFIINAYIGQLVTIRSLRGLPSSVVGPDGESHGEDWFEQHLMQSPHLKLPSCWYWIYKVQTCFFAGDHAGGLAAAAKAASVLGYLRVGIELADYHFYAALVRAAACDVTPIEGRNRHLIALSEHHQQIMGWAESCQANFANRAALVGAEIARIEGRTLEAMTLYEQAISSSQENGFVHNEALAYELAGRFYMTRGLKEFAHLYLRKARHCYLRWGADGKVRHLDELYPYLKEDEPAPALSGTIRAPIEHLDLATVVKVSQAISSEIVLQRLIDTLMRTAVEQAGAERGLLILCRAEGLKIVAEATTEGDAVTVQLHDDPATEVQLPKSVLQHVLRTHESVIVEDAAAQSAFVTDPYVLRHQSRSLLCLPLLNQAKLVGVLYLENQLAPGVFAAAQIAVLKLVSSQAAIALENSRLYSDLQQREAKIRRLVDANIIGILIWDLNGRIIDANDAFLRMLGYDREDLSAGRLRWTDLTPPEWRDRDEQERLPLLQKTGSLQPFEKEYFRKDGSRVPVLIGVAIFEEVGQSQGVAYVLDLTERKLAEEKLRRNEAFLAKGESVSLTGTFSWDFATGAFNWSDQLYRIYEFEPGTHITFELIATRYHPDDKAMIASVAEQARGGVAPTFDYGHRLLMPNGSIKHIRVVAHRNRNEDGRIEYFGAVQDVTQRHLTEEARRMSEGRWARVVDNSSIGISVNNLDGRFQVVNAAFQKLIGFTEEELRETTYCAITQRPFRDQNLALLEELLHGKRDQFDIEQQCRCKDGRLIWVRSNISLLPGADGNPRSIMAIIEDISPRKAAEGSLRTTQARLARAAELATAAELSASIAHEINQPLSGIITNANTCLRMLGADPPNVDGARETARRTLRDGNRASEIVARLRALFNKKPPMLELIDLNEAAREVIALLSSGMQANRVILRTELSDDLPPVRGDRVQLQQVMLNLIQNAIDSMTAVDHRVRQLLIQTRRDESDQVRVTVTDTGIGLPQGAAERVFESFYTTKSNGMGIGLTISRSIVEGHLGRLWVETNDGPGVTFSFSIPRSSGSPLDISALDPARSPVGMEFLESQKDV
jgi:PAS domain S-box-containing protein